MRLPAEKLARIQSQVRSWSQRQVCRRRQLEPLIGFLQHACRVVRLGRSFLRRMISLLSHSYRPYHHIHLTKQFRADLWHTFLPAWNGVFVLPVSTFRLLCVGRFRPVGMWSKVGCTMVPVQVAPISDDAPHLFPGVGSSVDGLSSVATNVARSDSLVSGVTTRQQFVPGC